jgi:hypothetical protein
MASHFFLLLLVVVSAAVAVQTQALPAPVPDTPGFSMLNITQYTVEAQYEESILYTLPESTALYAGSAVRLLHLRGSRQQMGYAYARLLASDVYEIYHHLISTLSLSTRIALERFIDFQWDNFLSKQLPEGMYCCFCCCCDWSLCSCGVVSEWLHFFF